MKPIDKLDGEILIFVGLIEFFYFHFINSSFLIIKETTKLVKMDLIYFLFSFPTTFHEDSNSSIIKEDCYHLWR